MSTRKLLLLATIGALLMIVALSVAAGLSHAQTVDDEFMDLLHSESMYPTPNSAVAAGLKVCHDMRTDYWYTGPVAVQDIWNNNTDMTLREAEWFVAASMVVYCPETTNRLKSQWPQ